METLPIQGDLKRGIDLFNRGHFFEAHEVLEDLWRSLPREPRHRQTIRRHVQGLIQLAVAFHHQSTGNHVGARSVLERALRNLMGSDSSFPKLDLERLRTELEPWRKYLHESEKNLRREKSVDHHRFVPALPKIMRRRKTS